MVSMIPHNQLSSKQKRAIIAENHSIYKKASRKEKTIILNELEKITGYSRKYIIFLLSLHKKKIYLKNKKKRLQVDITKSAKNKRGRKRKYPPYLAKILFKIWKIMGGGSSKHLKAFIDENFNSLWKYPELKDVPQKYRDLIRNMSTSTIERLLKPLRDKVKSKLFPYPLMKEKKKAAHLVKGKIEIQKWVDRKDNPPGTIEIDLVEHNGGNSRGDFLYTLNAVDITTYWVFLRILKNKARVWTKEALDDIISNAPFRTPTTGVNL